MKFNGNRGLADSELIEFETVIGFQLPPDYRSFLKRYNGGAFVDGYPEVSANVISTVACDCFFGLGMPRAADLVFWRNEMEGEIPADSLIFGKGPSGGFLLLCCGPQVSGVYFYDHGYVYPQSTDSENTYLICSDFREFARLVGIDID